MKITQKRLDDSKVLVDAIASIEEVAQAFTNGHLMFAQQMGLVPEQGKTVAQVAEEKLGVKDLDSIVQSQAVEYLVPFAVDKTGITPAFPPKPQVKSPLKRGNEFEFELLLEKKPLYELNSYAPVEITVPKFEYDEKQVDVQLAQIAEHYAEYVADRPHPVALGDSCLLSLESYENGKKLEALTTEARTYTTGANLMPEEFDKQIIGMNVGEAKTFILEAPGVDEDGKKNTEKIECTAVVKEIQKKVIPAINDSWVVKNMPMYKDLKDLRRNLNEGITKQCTLEYEEHKRTLAVTELGKRFEGDIADEVYEAMAQSLLSNLRMSVQQQNMTWEQFIEQQGGESQFNMMMMMQSRLMIVQGYALDALFHHENLSISDEDIEDACLTMNLQDPQSVRRHMEESGRSFALREVAERIKANKWLVQHAKITIE